MLQKGVVYEEKTEYLINQELISKIADLDDTLWGKTLMHLTIDERHDIWLGRRQALRW